MRALPANLAARLESGATTLCHCWSLTRRDGLALGFTDHDRDLSFGGVTYAARGGMEAAEVTAELGFAIGGGEVAGALTSTGIAPEDVAGGLYDGATVETWLVDWESPASRLLLDIATIGEIRRSGAAFVAELRGVMHRLEADQGRTYCATCDATLGEGRCGVNLDESRFRGHGDVRTVAGPLRLHAALAAAHPPGWFSDGRLTWIGGANAGLSADIRAHYGNTRDVSLELWQEPPRPVAVNDAFRLTAGCDKRFTTCREKFGNGVNFQGFPHMPGNDLVLRYAPSSGPLDGGSLFS